MVRRHKPVGIPEQILFNELCYIASLKRLGMNKPLLFQGAQCFTYGKAADVHLLRQLGFHQPIPRLQFSAADGFPDLPQCLIR